VYTVTDVDGDPLVKSPLFLHIVTHFHTKTPFTLLVRTGFTSEGELTICGARSSESMCEVARKLRCKVVCVCARECLFECLMEFMSSFHTYVFPYTYVHINISTCIYIYIYICIYFYIHIHIFTCIFICVYIDSAFLLEVQTVTARTAYRAYPICTSS